MASEAHATDVLLVTDGARLASIVTVLDAAAAEFGWTVRAQTVTGDDLDPDADQAAARAAVAAFRMPPVRVVRVVTGARDAAPVDAARVLARARQGDAGLLGGVQVDAVRSLHDD
jgi:serine protease